VKKQRSFNTLWMLVLVLPILLLTACSDEGTALENENEIVSETNPITVSEIEAAQVAWGDGLVEISRAYAEDEDYVAVALAVLEDLYGYDDGPVLFKPTVASEVPFRFDWDGAVSYFIGPSAPHPIDEDESGFATNDWIAVNFEDDWTFIINGETALGMGTVVITSADGDEVKVQKSMGWFRGTDGELKLQLHHSSVPFGE
jgi:hypothetical protein